MKYSIITFLLFLCACQQGIVPVYVDESETDEFIEAARRSVDFWNDRNNFGIDMIELHVRSHLGLAVFDVGSIVIRSKNEVGRTRAASGNTVHVVRWITIEDNEDSTFPLHYIISHELGHAMGLPHHSDPLNLMFNAPSGERAVWDMTTTAKQRRIVRATTLSTATLL